MANNKGGLGRGLGSLLGGTYDDDINKQNTQNKREVAPESQNTESRAQKSNEPKREIIDSEEQVVAEDNVTIKSVATREVKRSAAEKKDVNTGAPKAEGTVITREEGVKQTDEININYIEPNPDQPRSSFKKEELEELASSIERDGLLQPILVRKVDKNKYQIIAGERRYQACKQIGLKKVPVRVKEASESKALELALIENIQRSDLNPIEEAYGYRRIMERQKITQAELARMMSKGRSTIANSLRLLDLPEDAQQLLFEEKITSGHARAILSVEKKEDRQSLTEKLVKEKLSVRETENIARLLNNRPKKTGEKKQATPATYKAVAKELTNKLGTSVKVRSSKGKNKIEILFEDEKDLERIYELMINEDE